MSSITSTGRLKGRIERLESVSGTIKTSGTLNGVVSAVVEFEEYYRHNIATVDETLEYLGTKKNK